VVLLAFDATVSVETGIAALLADSPPVVEAPVLILEETPITMVKVMVCPPTVVTGGIVPPPPPVVPPPVVVVVVGGVEKPLVCEAPVAAPLSTPAVPLLTWAWFGNCQITDSTGLRLRAKRRFLIFNMIMIL
jgi:hypothetical protein